MRIDGLSGFAGIFALSGLTFYAVRAPGDDRVASYLEHPVSTTQPVASTTAPTAGPLNFTVKTIDGRDQDLSAYRGRVVMIVNVASKCGLTPQYKGLQELYTKYSDRGLVVVGFPANNFMGQEPGSNEQIAAFCSTKYNVTFPMMAKISVKGNDKHPLYAYLTEPTTAGEFAGEIGWNFAKFLIGRDGRLIARFDPRTSPTDLKVVKAIEDALATQ